MLKPCPDCGELTAAAYCALHQPAVKHPPKPPANKRGYDWAWTKLSLRARRMQPFCTDCGTRNDLQADHTPQAWARKAAGLTIRLQDIDVVCGPCNRNRGAARGPHTERERETSKGTHFFAPMQPQTQGGRGTATPSRPQGARQTFDYFNIQPSQEVSHGRP